MDHAWESNASGTPPSFPAGLQTGYPTETPVPTVTGAWWYHQITEEIRNAIISGGITPSASAVNQLGLAIQAMVASSGVPATTRQPFAQAAAPTGWVRDTSDSANNRMLRVVSSGGGGVGGSADPTYNNVVPAHTHGVTTYGQSSGHNHSMYDPTHTHGVNMGLTDYDQGTFGGGRPSVYGTQYTNAAGTGVQTYGVSNDHYHGGSTDNGSSQTNWAPRYIDMIICAKS